MSETDSDYGEMNSGGNAAPAQVRTLRQFAHGGSNPDTAAPPQPASAACASASDMENDETADMVMLQLASFEGRAS